MKVAIIGKGTGAVLTALVCYYHGVEFDIFFDPETPILPVGESTTPHVGDLIKKSLNISVGELVEKGIVSFKTGVRFIDWGCNPAFLHHFHTNKLAFHFEMSEFNPFIHDELEHRGVQYIGEKVETIKDNGNTVFLNDHEYDFVFQCSGWSDTDEYYEPLLETVNAALLYPSEGIIDPFYTLHEATPDGWQLGLPFPDRNLQKRGYLFNTKYTTVEEAKLKVPENARLVEWKPKICKKLIQSKNIAYVGNRLFFTEPMHALSMYYYELFVEKICTEYLQNKTREAFCNLNYFYRREMTEYEMSIAFHYRYGSLHQTPFWTDVRDKAKELFRAHPNSDADVLVNNIQLDISTGYSDLSNIGAFTANDVRMVHCGMTQTGIDF